MNAKTHRGLDLTAAIISIVFSAFLLLSCLCCICFLDNFIYVYSPMEAYGNYYVYEHIDESIIVGSFIIAFLSEPILLLAIFLCGKDIAPKKKLITDIVLIVLLGFFVLLLFYAIAMEDFSTSLFLILPATAFVLKIITVSTRPKKIAVAEGAPETPIIPEKDRRAATEEKIKKIEEFKEQGIITQEQYATAIEKLIHDFVA